jgi:hypothetical protein
MNASQATTKSVEVELFFQNAPLADRAIGDAEVAARVLAELTGTEVGELEIERGYDLGLWLAELPTWMVEGARETGELFLQGTRGAVLEAVIEQV